MGVDPVSCLKDQVAAYERWRGRCSRMLRALEDWLCERGRDSETSSAAIAAARAETEADRLRIAVCATVGSGRIELINALFFADYGRAWLPPNAAGDCPIEIGWDADSGASLRLLPIETRDESSSLAELHQQPERWVSFPLRPQEPNQLDAVLAEIQQTKRLSVDRASRLGLASVGEESRGGIEVQRWRYARISFPHPLLSRGLLVNAATCSLKGDPDLFHASCSLAQMTLFLIAADRGLSQDVLDLWQSRLEGFRDEEQKRILVLLTGTDRLRAGGGDPQAEIARVRAETARRLGINPARVLPVSARLGLDARANPQAGTWTQNGLAELERVLCEELLRHKYQALGARLGEYLEGILEANRRELGVEIDDARREIDRLSTSVAEGQARIAELVASTKDQQERYLLAVKRFGHIRGQIVDAAVGGRRRLRAEVVDEMVREAHRAMAASWLSVGIARAVRELFAGLHDLMTDADADARELRGQLAALYQSCDEQLGLQARPPPEMFQVQDYLAELEQLSGEAAGFCWQPGRLAREQAALMRLLHQQLFARARILFARLHDDWAGWIRDAVTPLAEAVDGLKVETEAKLDQLKRVSAARIKAREQLMIRRRQHVELARQMTTLRNIQNALEHDPSRQPQHATRLKLVGGRQERDAASGS